MIYYPLQTLINAGIRDILLVTGGQHAGDFLRLLGNGQEFGLTHLNYAYQEGEGGMAAALGLAEHFADGGRVRVLVGVNLIEGSIVAVAAARRRQARRRDGRQSDQRPCHPGADPRDEVGAAGAAGGQAAVAGMRLLVTGAAGFIGTNFVRSALARPTPAVSRLVAVDL